MTSKDIIIVKDDQTFFNYLAQSSTQPFVAIFIGSSGDTTDAFKYSYLAKTIFFNPVIIVMNTADVPYTVREQNITRTPMLKIFHRGCMAQMDDCSDVAQTYDFIYNNHSCFR